jgi:hypothetical protein
MEPVFVVASALSLVRFCGRDWEMVVRVLVVEVAQGVECLKVY